MRMPYIYVSGMCFITTGNRHSLILNITYLKWSLNFNFSFLSLIIFQVLFL